jgi:hypothetical protein
MQEQRTVRKNSARYAKRVTTSITLPLTKRKFMQIMFRPKRERLQILNAIAIGYHGGLSVSIEK